MCSITDLNVHDAARQGSDRGARGADLHYDGEHKRARPLHAHGKQADGSGEGLDNEEHEKERRCRHRCARFLPIDKGGVSVEAELENHRGTHAQE